MNRVVPSLLIAVLALVQPGRAQETRPGHDGHDHDHPASRESRPADGGHGEHAGHGDHAGHGGGRGGMLMVETEPAAPKAGAATTLKLMIHDAEGTMVAAFETFHEKKVHLMIVRDGLDEFAHVHPDLDDSGNMKLTHTFPMAGLYRLYADYKPVKKEQALATAEVRVAGAAPQAPKLEVSAPGKAKGDGLDAEIALDGTKAGSPVTISFRVLDPAGKPVTDLEPYLGAMGHLVLISADGKEYVHVHPLEKQASKDKVDFQAHIAKAGVYKGWGQFQRAGKVHVVPFVVKIE
jgi:hypothetical protein